MKKCRICNKLKSTTDFYKNDKTNRCKECEKLRKKKERLKRSHSKTDRNQWLKKKYNITENDYNEMLIKQNGVCAICGEKGLIKKGKLCVDHCHTTGKVRGLLCHSCNVSLGLMKDKISNLENAIKYLKNYD